MSPKLQCHCNVGYKKNIHCHDHFHIIFSSLSHTGAANRLGLNYQTNLLRHTQTASIQNNIIYIVSPTTTHFTCRTVSSLTFISNASMAPGIGMFLFVSPTTEKSFFLFFFDFETIASFTHVLYQYDNGAAQCFVIYYLCMN